MDVEERVEAGVDAADGAGTDTEDAARTRKAMAKMVARLGRASPAVPSTWMALLGRARPAALKEP